MFCIFNQFFSLYHPDNERKKRRRRDFLESEVIILENYYKKSCYISYTDRINLAQELGLHESQITLWFKNRRAKTKRLNSLSPTDTAYDEDMKGRILQHTSESSSPSQCASLSTYTSIPSPSQYASTSTYTSKPSPPVQWVQLVEPSNFMPNFFENTMQPQQVYSAPAPLYDACYRPYYSVPPVQTAAHMNATRESVITYAHDNLQPTSNFIPNGNYNENYFVSQSLPLPPPLPIIDLKKENFTDHCNQADLTTAYDLTMSNFEKFRRDNGNVNAEQESDNDVQKLLNASLDLNISSVSQSLLELSEFLEYF